MARTDFRTPRLYVSQDLAAGAEVKLDPQQTNYLVNVLRLGAGAPVLLFNGRDGEFSASLDTSSRKAASLAVGAQTRAQEAPPDVDYLFAPLKHARLDYMAQKAVEMGARRLAAGHHPPHPGRARQSGASARQRDRGLRTMRRDLDSGDCAGRAARRSAQALAGRAPPRLLRRGGGAGQPARRARERARGRRRRPPDWAGRRLRRRRARRDPLGAARASPEPRAAHPARRHGRGGGAGAHPGDAWRLAEKRTTGISFALRGRVRHFAATMWLHPGQR